MRRSSTAWPKRESSRAMSTTVRPVTQTALVAVNRASISESGVPTTAASSLSRRPPMMIAAAKLAMRMRSGCSPLSSRQVAHGRWHDTA
jgi:hypothetical protein